MSTNTEGQQLPDVKLLEKLANDLFSAYGSEQAPDAHHLPPRSPANQEISVNQGNAVDMKDPQTSLHDPHRHEQIPASAGGSGISPATAGNVNQYQVNSANAKSPETQTILNGNVPGSVGGSGISPARREAVGKAAGMSDGKPPTPSPFPSPQKPAPPQPEIVKKNDQGLPRERR